jgi:predicted transcriptional regulator
MQTNSEYQSYLVAMQNYETTQGRKEYQAPFANGFEAIYNKAKEQEIGFSNAKEFLQTLSQSELQTLQKYSGLAESVDVKSLSSEGAYNLLLHDNEQYDFNGDGVAEVGIGKHILPVPTTMPADVRDAYISAMNALSDKEKLMVMSLTFDPARLTSEINNTSYTPTTIDYNFLKEQVQNRLHPKDGAYTSEEAKLAVAAFWNAFNASFTGDKTANEVEQTDSAVAQFLKDLRTKGAAKFLSDLNQEKIDKLVEEYRAKLIENMGDSPEALQKIEELVEKFKQQLIEEMKEKMEEEAKSKKKNTPPVTSNRVVQELIDLAQKQTVKPLEELLQS